MLAIYRITDKKPGPDTVRSTEGTRIYADGRRLKINLPQRHGEHKDTIFSFAAHPKRFADRYLDKDFKDEECAHCAVQSKCESTSRLSNTSPARIFPLIPIDNKRSIASESVRFNKSDTSRRLTLPSKYNLAT